MSVVLLIQHSRPDPRVLTPECSDYLYQAAEVVRRDPYCREIQLVDFSVDGVPESQSPQVFVQATTTYEKYAKNYYFSISDIIKAYQELDDI